MTRNKVPSYTGSSAAFVAPVIAAKGTANYTLNWGDYSFAGIALGTLAAVVIYQALRFFEPEVPPHTGIGDSLLEPLARTADRRRPDTA